MREETKDLLNSYIYSCCPIIYINHDDFTAVDDALTEAAKAVSDNVRFCEFNNALGVIDFKDKHTLYQCSLEDFLSLVMDDGFEETPLFIILKDIHRSINSPVVIALLRRIAERYVERKDYHARTNNRFV